MGDHSLTEVEIEKEGMKVRLKKGGNGKFISDGEMPMMMQAPQVMPTAAPAAGAPAPKPVDAANVVVIKSPMVGTYYSAPGPDQPQYLTPGKKVSDGDVLCIVEAMKLMNEIKSELSGTVLEILVKNGQPVEFDQPLFKIQKA